MMLHLPVWMFLVSLLVACGAGAWAAIGVRSIIASLDRPKLPPVVRAGWFGPPDDPYTRQRLAAALRRHVR